MDPLLESVRTIWGARRFWPPGRHPATARARRLLADLEAKGLADSPVGDRLREELAVFEEGESIRKAEMLRHLLRRRR